MVFLKEFFENFDFENNQQIAKRMKIYPLGKELIDWQNSVMECQ